MTTSATNADSFQASSSTVAQGHRPPTSSGHEAAGTPDQRWTRPTSERRRPVAAAPTRCGSVTTATARPITTRTPPPARTTNVAIVRPMAAASTVAATAVSRDSSAAARRSPDTAVKPSVPSRGWPTRGSRPRLVATTAPRAVPVTTTISRTAGATRRAPVIDVLPGGRLTTLRRALPCASRRPAATPTPRPARGSRCARGRRRPGRRPRRGAGRTVPHRPGRAVRCRAP